MVSSTLYYTTLYYTILYCIHPLIHLTIQLRIDTRTYIHHGQPAPSHLRPPYTRYIHGSHTQRETLTPAIISLTKQPQVCWWKHVCTYFTVTPPSILSHSVLSPVSESPSPSSPCCPHLLRTQSWSPSLFETARREHHGGSVLPRRGSVGWLHGSQQCMPLHMRSLGTG